MTFYDLERQIQEGPKELLPFFWKILRENAQDPEKIILQGAEAEFRDIYLGIMTRYRGLSILGCPEDFPAMLRLIVVRDLPEEIKETWNNLTDFQKKFFEERYFLIPDGGKYRLNIEFRDVDVFTEFPDGKGHSLAKGTYYTVGEGFVLFEKNPVENIPDGMRDSESVIRAPWRTRYGYREIFLYASGVRGTYSPLEENYVKIVMDEEYKTLADEALDYNQFIYSVYRVMYKGATEEALQYFVNILAGSPVIRTQGEKVIKIFQETVGTTTYNVIETTGGEYRLPEHILPAPWVHKDAVLDRNTPVGNYIRVDTYYKDPEWVHSYTIGSYMEIIDKSTWDSDPLVFDLVTEFTAEEAAAASWEQAPRFDLMPFQDKSAKTFRTGSYGLWHKVCGPSYLGIHINDWEFPENKLDSFRFMLREIIPVDLMYSVTQEPVPGGG